MRLPIGVARTMQYSFPDDLVAVVPDNVLHAVQHYAGHRAVRGVVGLLEKIDQFRKDTNERCTCCRRPNTPPREIMVTPPLGVTHTRPVVDAVPAAASVGWGRGRPAGGNLNRVGACSDLMSLKCFGKTGLGSEYVPMPPSAGTS